MHEISGSKFCCLEWLQKNSQQIYGAHSTPKQANARSKSPEIYKASDFLGQS